MGFDNECVLNIQSLAGEYFCPVCRTLVYPKEALQLQCTHLYCKPCLAYVVSSTQACPYDGYLVTEAGSKPLTESNKALAETIGKTLVHCLYHRSGCTWQGALSECTSHCSGCAFGNSPVVCNRCGVQIVHRQVQEHAQTCNVNVANPQTQPGTASVQDSSTSGAIVASEQNKSGVQPGVLNSQSSGPQTVAVPPPGQNPNNQGNTNPSSLAVTPNAVPTPEQWYQYQQYYQQYSGYDPYQQGFQQYYPYQPQAGQQIQQHPPLVQGQPHPQLQPTQPLAQAQVQAQPHLYPPAPVSTQNQNQGQSNQPQRIHPVPPYDPHPPPPPPLGPLPPQPYPRAHPQQHMQGPQIQYQQAHPQAPSLPHPQAPGHPQQQHSLPQPPQANQPPTLIASHPNQYSSIQPVTGHHSYQQPQGHQQMQYAPPQQHMMHIHPSGVHLPPMQVQGQFPQPPAHLRPLQPFPPNQPPPTHLPSQGHTTKFPLAHQQIHPNNQQTGPSIQQRPVMQPQQYMPQAPPFTAQVQNPIHPAHFTQQHPHLFSQGPLQAMHKHPLPYIQPQQNVAVAHGMQRHQSQSHVARPVMPNHEVQLQQFPQTTGALGGPPQLRTTQHSSNEPSAFPSYGNTVSNQLQASSGQHLVQSEFQANAKMVKRKGDQTSEISFEQKDAGSPSQKSLEKDVIGLGAGFAEGKSVLGMKPNVDEHKPSSEGDDSCKHEERTKDALEGKEISLEPSTEVGKAGNSHANADSLKQADKTVVNASLQSSAEGNNAGGSQAVNYRDHLHHGPVGDESGGFQGKGFEQSSHPSQFTDYGRRQLPPMPYGSSAHQQRLHVPSMSQAFPSTGPPFDGHLQSHVPLGPPGPVQGGFELQYGAPPGHSSQGHIPSSHAGLPRMSQGEGMGPLMSSAPPVSFESQDRLMGRAPTLRGPEIHSGPPRPITPMDGNMFSNHRPPHLEEHSNHFPMGPIRHLGQTKFQDGVKPFPVSSHMGSEASPKFGNSIMSSRPTNRGPLVPGMDGSHRNHDKGSHGLNYDAGRNVEPSVPGGFLPPYRPGALHLNESGERGWAVGNNEDNRGISDSGRSNPDFHGPAPGSDRHHKDGFPSRSPGREYFGNQSRPFGDFSGGIDDIDGRETRPFGERSGSFNHPSDSGVHSLHENRFPIRPPGHMRRRDFEGPGNLQLGEHIRSGDFVGPDVLPIHLRRGEPFDPRNISGHPPSKEHDFASFGYGHIGESAGPGGFPLRPFGESFGQSSHSQLGEPGFRSSYTSQGFPIDGGPFAGESNSFDNIRKRKPLSTGWCRICRVDCETVEGLDMHSQTREHQKMTMDMVISIKENGKRQKTFKGHSAREEGNKSRNAGFPGRGK